MLKIASTTAGRASADGKSLIAANVGLAANAVLAVLKTTVGIFGHSPALLAEGVNSTSDVAYSVIVSLFMRLAHKPADREHPYGHRHLESIAALVVGAFVITTAIAIFWQSVNTIYELLTAQSQYAGASAIALWVALLTVIVKLALTVGTQQIARQTQSVVVLALARDHRNDVLSALAAATGILLGRMGYPWVDPLAGALVALVVLWTGITILRDASVDLMPTAPDLPLADLIGEVLAAIPEVRQVEDIHVHRFGPYLVLNLTIGVDGSLTIAHGDEIASQVEAALYRSLASLRRVHVHYHPTQR